jgi:murein L,D-transpeptidase YcbB/YkuD
MRQLPGGGNVMGAMKFMMPNELGIYLHDYPDKSLFARAERRISSGCVRVEDAPRLAAWLFGGKAPTPQSSAPEQEVDLPEPVPVYITYLTMLPAKGGGLVFTGDPYKRDAAALAALSSKRTGA